MERVLFCPPCVILTVKGMEVAGIRRKFTQQEVWQHMRGRIYCNPYDKNLFVRRRMPGAWTVNLGNPWAWCAVGALALAACAAVWLVLRLSGA